MSDLRAQASDTVLLCMLEQGSLGSLRGCQAWIGVSEYLQCRGLENMVSVFAVLSSPADYRKLQGVSTLGFSAAAAKDRSDRSQVFPCPFDLQVFVTVPVLH